MIEETSATTGLNTTMTAQRRQRWPWPKFGKTTAGRCLYQAGTGFLALVLRIQYPSCTKEVRFKLARQLRQCPLQHSTLIPELGEKRPLDPKYNGNGNRSRQVGSLVCPPFLSLSLSLCVCVCVGVFVRLVVSLFVPILLLHHHHLLLLSLCIYPKQT